MSGGELLLLLLIAVLALGAHRLPGTGRMLGKGLRNFHRALNEARDSIESDVAPRRPGPPARRLID